MRKSNVSIANGASVYDKNYRDSTISVDERLSIFNKRKSGDPSQDASRITLSPSVLSQNDERPSIFQQKGSASPSFTQ